MRPRLCSSPSGADSHVPGCSAAKSSSFARIFFFFFFFKKACRTASSGVISLRPEVLTRWV